MHIDDWINSPVCKDDGEKYAKFVFWFMRYPAWAQHAFSQWMKPYPLFCTHEGTRYRCTTASRLGDIGLHKDPSQDMGYTLRVDVADCSEWSNSFTQPIVVEE